MMNDMYISLNDFYYEIGLDPIKIGSDIGWNIDDGYIDLRFSSQLAQMGHRVLLQIMELLRDMIFVADVKVRRKYKAYYDRKVSIMKGEIYYGEQ